ncbi:hypothetical protein [Patulibacter americanus]|uniref:hypothetical protein n=1 Tax=Patulibacter americanus TaxID=588672 RepID=UPI0003B6FE32|nr:hypothetical protein [Patulibacter americanus]
MQLFLALTHRDRVPEDLGDAARAACAAVAAAVPGLADGHTHSWSSVSGRTVVVGTGHPPDRTGGPGRVWGDAGRRQVLDGFPIDRARPLPTDGPVDVTGLDGRFGLLDVAGDEVAVTCDRMGAYALYVRELPRGEVALSNSPSLLARLPPHPGFDHAAIEDYLVASWIFGVRTPWAGVHRLPPGRTTAREGRLRPSSDRLVDVALAAAERPVHRDVEAGAELLRDTVAAVARDAPGPLELGLSGGRDSRVILSAALAAGVEPHCFTNALEEDPAYPETDDVRVARTLTSVLGLPHEVRTPTTHADDAERWMRAVTAGVSPFDSTPSSVGTDGRTPIVLSGTAVELGWLTHGIALTQGTSQDDVVRESVAAWVHTRPGHLGRRGAYERVCERGAEGPRAWAAAGLPTAFLAEAFFVLERTANWAAPTHFAYEPYFDTVAPGWSADLLPVVWSLHEDDREHDRWRRGMIHALCPQLERLPFGGAATTWPDDADRAGYMLWGEKADKIRRTIGSATRGNGVRRVAAQADALRRMQREVRVDLRRDGALREHVDPTYAGVLARAPLTRMPPRMLQQLVRLTHVARLLREA